MKSTNRSGKITFATPKTLLNWARNAAAEFRRADAYCSKLWNADEMKPTKSGDCGMNLISIFMCTLNLLCVLLKIILFNFK